MKKWVALLVALMTAAVVTGFSATASAASAPGGIVLLHQSTPAPTNTTIDIGWNATSGATSYTVSRSGLPAYTGSTTGTHFKFTLLTPGTFYTLTVAARNASDIGPASSVTVSTTGTTITVSGVSMSATNADNPLFKSAVINSGTGLATCNLYHFLDQVCGDVSVSFTESGYAGPTAGDFWLISADITRTFGCYNTTTGAFAAVTAITGRKFFSQYASYFSSPATGTRVSGDYFFSNPTSWGGENDMPAPFACPWGTVDRVSHGTTVSNVSAGVYNTGGVGGDPTTPALATVAVPGTANASFTDPG